MKNQKVTEKKLIEFFRGKKIPLSTTEIMLNKELNIITEKDFFEEIGKNPKKKAWVKMSMFGQKHLKKLEEKGFIFRIERNQENKKMLKDVFKKDWSRFSHSYYLYAEHPKSKALRESVEEFIKFFSKKELCYLENKEELLQETDKLIRFLSEIVFLSYNKNKKIDEGKWIKKKFSNILCSVISLKDIKKKYGINSKEYNEYLTKIYTEKEIKEKFGLNSNEYKFYEKYEKKDILESYTDLRLEENLFNTLFGYLSLKDFLHYNSKINPKRVEEIKSEIEDSLLNIIEYINEGNIAVKVFIEILEEKSKKP